MRTLLNPQGWAAAQAEVTSCAMSQYHVHAGHEILLLALNPRGGSTVSWYTLYVGIAAAILLHWMFHDDLVYVKASTFYVRPTPGQWASVDYCAKKLTGEHTYTERTVMNYLPQFTRASLDLLGQELADQGVMEKTEDRFLGILWRRRHKPIGTLRQQIIDRFRTHMAQLDARSPLNIDDGMISILRRMDLLGTVWTEQELADIHHKLLIRTNKVNIGAVLGDLGAARGL